MLYRYDPRQVELEDPDKHPYCRPTVHHTVVERLVDGSDDYAPLALGEISADVAARGAKGADVLMPDGSITRAETGSDYTLIRKADRASEPENLQSDDSELDIAQVAMKKLDAPDRNEMEIARDYVWLNRIAYYFFVALFLMVITLPLIAPAIEDFNKGVWSQISGIALPFQWLLHVLGPIGDALSRFMSGFENVLRGMGDTILSFTPSYLYAHVKAALNHPFFSIALVIGYFFLRYKSDSYEDATRYHARLAWNIQNDKLKKDIEPEPSATSTTRARGEKLACGKICPWRRPRDGACRLCDCLCVCAPASRRQSNWLQLSRGIWSRLRGFRGSRMGGERICTICHE